MNILYEIGDEVIITLTGTTPRSATVVSLSPPHMLYPIIVEFEGHYDFPTNMSEVVPA